MFAIRWFLGRIILLVDWLFPPKRGLRSEGEQQLVDSQTEKLSLYQYLACPFCVKVRRAAKRQSLSIETHDARRCEASRDALVNGGGSLKVPCLRIEGEDGEVRWMYESKDIIAYLEATFPTQAA